MVVNRWRLVTWPILVAMMASPWLMDCGGGGGAGPMGGLPGIPGGPAKCPDLKDPDAVMKANFGLQADMEGKVKAGIAAAADLQNLAVQLEGDVVTACSGLAKDLGASEADLKTTEEGPGKKAEHTCNVAVKFLNDAKLKAKAAGTLTMKIQEPKCSASVEAAADCAAQCDASVKGGAAEVKCEGGELSGKCDAECKGSCELNAGAQCTGECGGDCSGKCDGTVSGTCDGNCDGKCDGKDSKGKCAGKCDGKCNGNAKASCTGKCSGTCSATCKVSTQSKCDGTCSGSCSVKMKEPKCSGKLEMPHVSAECKGHCDAKLSAKATCTPASVKVVFVGGADAKAGAQLATALEKNLPLLLKVAVGMKGRAESAIGSVKTSVEGLESVVKGGADVALKAGACVSAALKAQAEASVSINVSIKASASASGSARAGG